MKAFDIRINLKLILKLHICIYLDDQISAEPIPDTRSYFERFSIYCCSCRCRMERRRQLNWNAQGLKLSCFSGESQEENESIIDQYEDENHPNFDQRTPIVRSRSNGPMIQANLEQN